MERHSMSSQVRTLNTAKRAIFSNWSTDSGDPCSNLAYFGGNDIMTPDFMWKGKGPRTLNSLWGKTVLVREHALEFKTELWTRGTRPHNRWARLGMQASEHGWDRRWSHTPTASWVSTRRPALFNVQMKVFSIAPRCWDAHVHSNEWILTSDHIHKN